MEIGLLNVRITFQENAVAVDGIGNHKNTWADYYSCHATVSGEAGNQTSESDVAGTVADESSISFTVRYCKKASVIDSTGYRVAFGGELYDILAVDHMNYKKEMPEIQVQESEAVTMANGVSIDRMAEEIMKGLAEYADLAAEDMKKAVKKAGAAVRKDIGANAPKDTGKYAKSWMVKTTKETSNSLQVTVHSKNRYQLAHLLEYGHAKRGGGRVSAKPHIAAAEQAGVELLEKEIQKALGDNIWKH